MSNETPQIGRAVMTFSVEGLAAREELLVKSFVRLLKHRTIHDWFYQAQPADLRMVADGVLSKNLAVLSGEQQQALVLGATPSQRPNYLCLPLRADELLAELNRLGGLIAAARPALTDTPDWSRETIRLLRWPPAALVATPQRMRLATLLTGKPLTLAQLQLRSGQSLVPCTQFLDDLHRAGLLDRPQQNVGKAAVVPVATAKLAIAPLGLLARIRSRLGILNSGKS